MAGFLRQREYAIFDVQHWSLLRASGVEASLPAGWRLASHGKGGGNNTPNGSIAQMAKKAANRPDQATKTHQVVKLDHAGRKKLTLWVSPQKHAEIKQTAEDDRRSMTAWILILVDKALDEAKRKK
jgi:hypothetical protein